MDSKKLQHAFADRISASLIGASDWWDRMPKDKKKQYIKVHPNSKYAKDFNSDDDIHGEEDKKETKKSSKKRLVKESKNKENTPTVPDDKERPKEDSGSIPPKESESGQHGNTEKIDLDSVKAPTVKSSKISRALGKVWPRLSKPDRAFFTSGTEANSKPRSKAAHLVKKKSCGIIAHMKNQAKEWGHATKAIHKIATRTPLTEHDKVAMKKVTKDIVVATTSICLGGGLAHGLVALIPHVGHYLIEEFFVTALAHGVIEAKTLKPDDKGYTEAVMKEVIEQFADYIKSHDIDDTIWAELAIKVGKSNKTQ